MALLWDDNDRRRRQQEARQRRLDARANERAREIARERDARERVRAATPRTDVPASVSPTPSASPYETRTNIIASAASTITDGFRRLCTTASEAAAATVRAAEQQRALDRAVGDVREREMRETLVNAITEYLSRTRAGGAPHPDGTAYGESSSFSYAVTERELQLYQSSGYFEPIAALASALGHAYPRGFVVWRVRADYSSTSRTVIVGVDIRPVLADLRPAVLHGGERVLRADDYPTRHPRYLNVNDDRRDALHYAYGPATMWIRGDEIEVATEAIETTTFGDTTRTFVPGVRDTRPTIEQMDAPAPSPAAPSVDTPPERVGVRRIRVRE